MYDYFIRIMTVVAALTAMAYGDRIRIWCRDQTLRLFDKPPVAR